MPRDGSGIYTYPPGTPGIPDTTIESAKYNGYIADIQQDLNLPRPIVAGGTGANNATQARTNLQAEVNGVQVTNFDSHPWESGSWYCLSNTTGAPTTGFFQGICYVYPTSTNIVVEARLIDPAQVPAPLYVRSKVNGVWGAWARDGSDRFVEITGDTMTGNLVLTGSTATVAFNPQDLLNPVGLNWYRSSQIRWGLVMQTAATSDFAILRYNDGGVLLDAPISISRATGNVIIPNNLNTAAISASNLSVTNALTCGGVQTNAIGAGNSFVALANNLGVIQSYYYWLAGSGNIEVTFGAGSAYSVSMRPTGHVYGGQGWGTRSGYSGAYGSSSFNIFYNAGPVQLWIDTSNMGNITLTSDYRIKKDIIDLPGMWDTVKAMRPIKYTRQDYTPKIEAERMLKQAIEARAAGLDTPEAKPGSELQPWMKGDDIERWGFIAHELQDTLTPSVASGVKDQADAVQALNIDGIVAALTKALQEAMARIEVLEAAQAMP